MTKPTQRVAEHAVETLSKLITLNAKYNGDLIKPSYIDAMERARKTLQRRIAYDEFPRNEEETV